MMVYHIKLQQLSNGMHRKTHVQSYVNWHLNTSIPMLTESSKQPKAKISHINFREHINHVYKTHWITSVYAHMYGTVHWNDMDGNQNGQHLTLQVTNMQLKIVN
jgi:hypothetical protein